MNNVNRVLFYVGAPKTGTTSVQGFLSDNREAILQQGIYIPLAGRAGINQHIELPKIIGSGRKRNGLDRHTYESNLSPDERMAQFLRSLNAELRRLNDTVSLLFYSEYLFSSNAKEINLYRKLFSAYTDNFEVIMYLRRQDQWLASLTLQARKTGARLDLELNRGSPQRFGESVRAWMSNSDIAHVRRLDSALLKGGNLVEDFCSCVCISLDGLRMREDKSNTALLQEQIEVVDILNRNICAKSFQQQILIRSSFVSLCTKTLGGTPIEFRRDDAVKVFRSFERINQFLHDSVDPAGPPQFFNDRFDGYKEKPQNDRKYSTGQIMQLLGSIEDSMKKNSVREPRRLINASRTQILEHVVALFVAFREAELREHKKRRLASAADRWSGAAAAIPHTGC